MDRSYALLLLFVRLRQIHSVEGVLRIFTGALEELWPGLETEIRGNGAGDPGSATGDHGNGADEHGADKHGADKHGAEETGAGGASASAGEEEVFPLASHTRRHGELVLRPEAGSPLSLEDRGLLFNAVELLQQYLENIDRRREAEDLKSVLEEAARRRGMVNLTFARELLSQVGEVVSAREIAERLGWAEAVEEILLESGQGGERITAGEVESLAREFCSRTISPAPSWNASFATVESGATTVSLRSGWSTVFFFRELLEGLRGTLFDPTAMLSVSLSVASYGEALAVSLLLSLGDTQGSPRNLPEASRKLLDFYADRGGLSFEESWEWGVTRFTVRMEQV